MSTTFPFPANPVFGQTVTLTSGQQMVFNSYAWETGVANYGQGNIAFVLVGSLVDLSATAMPSSIGTSWSLLNYV